MLVLWSTFFIETVIFGSFSYFFMAYFPKGYFRNNKSFFLLYIIANDIPLYFLIFLKSLFHISLPIQNYCRVIWEYQSVELYMNRWTEFKGLRGDYRTKLLAKKVTVQKFAMCSLPINQFLSEQKTLAAHFLKIY